MTTAKVKNNDGTACRGWKYGTFTAINVGNGPARRIKGWTLISPDGCERNCEGNWQQFVPFANLILENYGCQSRFS